MTFNPEDTMTQTTAIIPYLIVSSEKWSRFPYWMSEAECDYLNNENSACLPEDWVTDAYISACDAYRKERELQAAYAEEIGESYEPEDEEPTREAIRATMAEEFMEENERVDKWLPKHRIAGVYARGNGYSWYRLEDQESGAGAEYLTTGTLRELAEYLQA